MAWSLATIGGAPIVDAEILGVPWDADAMAAIEHQVARAAYEIIQRKGDTNWAIGAVIDSLVTTIVRNERAIVPVSVPVAHLGGDLHDLPVVCLSLPARMGSDGVEGIVVPPLVPGEVASLRTSASALAESLSALDMG